MEALSPIPRVDLGNQVAEDDRHLTRWYIPNRHLTEAANTTSRLQYFIGKKGSGKSAILEMIRHDQPNDRVINLSREDIGLDLIAEYHDLESMNAPSRRLLFRTVWDATLMLLVYERLKNRSRSAKQSSSYKPFMTMSKLINESRVLPECSAILRFALHRITSDFMQSRSNPDVDIRTPVFTRTLANTEFISLVSHAKRNFEDLISDTCTYVLIDDLDRQWINKSIQNEFIAALFEAIERLSPLDALKFVVALRFDIFRSLELDSPDKLHQHLYHIQWSNKELKSIVMKRMAESLTEGHGRIGKRFDVGKGGDSIAYIIDRCFPLPRDVIATFQLLLDEASASNSCIVDNDICNHVMVRMSSERVRWICSEWRDTYPWIDPALRQLSGGVHVFKHDHLASILDKGESKNIPCVDRAIEGLLNTGFIGIKGKPDGKATFYIHEPAHEGPYEKNRYYELHPAVTKAIQSNRW